MMAPLILFANRDNVLFFLNDKMIHCVVIGGKGNTRKLSYFMSKVHYLETDGEKRCRVSSQQGVHREVIHILTSIVALVFLS